MVRAKKVRGDGGEPGSGHLGADRRWQRGERAGGEEIRRRAIGLRIAIRFLASASRRAIKRLQPTRPAGSFASLGLCG
jgi:hypothetical protein